MNELESLVRLNGSGMVGSALLRRLRERFALEEIHRLSQPQLERVPGIGPLIARAILEAPDPGREFELARERGIEILPCTSPGFPPGLHVTVVSGLARGIDTAAHSGALWAREGRTIAVLGSGRLRVYPPENARLLDEVCARGAAFSEFPLLQGPETANFPRRNRLISGLSLGILVVEAAERSGALITADWALEQGRDVFCVSGPVESPLSRGCHRLIQQDVQRVFRELGPLEEIPAFASLVEPVLSLSSLERAVLRHLGEKPCTAESIAAATRLPGPSVENALTGLVTKGAARSEGPLTFVRGPL